MSAWVPPCLPGLGAPCRTPLPRVPESQRVWVSATASQTQAPHAARSADGGRLISNQQSKDKQQSRPGLASGLLKGPRLCAGARDFLPRGWATGQALANVAARPPALACSALALGSAGRTEEEVLSQEMQPRPGCKGQWQLSGRPLAPRLAFRRGEGAGLDGRPRGPGAHCPGAQSPRLSPGAAKRLTVKSGR